MVSLIVLLVEPKGRPCSPTQANIETYPSSCGTFQVGSSGTRHS